jgi:hypothetical protein
MTDVNVMVVFYSRYGETERLALAAGLGAVQAHANLRLRRLKDLADAEIMLRDPRWSESLERMIADYIAPREIDADWADVILLVSCPDSPAETEQYVTALRAHRDNRRKLQTVFAAGDPAERLRSALAQGKQAVEATRQRRLGANA